MISISKARANIYQIIRDLSAGGDRVVVENKGGNVVIISETELAELEKATIANCTMQPLMLVDNTPPPSKTSPNWVVRSVDGEIRIKIEDS